MSNLSDEMMKQTFQYFKGDKDELDFETYLEIMRCFGVVYNKEELKKKEEEKKSYTYQDIINDYKKKNEELSKDVLLNAFKIFDPENTGAISYDQFQRALTTYGEKLNKQELEEFVKFFGIKENESVPYPKLVEQMMTA